MSDQSIILLVEDNDDHVLLLRRAFKSLRMLNPLQVVRSGEEAIEYLGGIGRYLNRKEFPLPSLVLLDLKLKGIDGFDVLRWIRGQDGLRKLRVVVLSSSNLMSDVNEAYQLGANSFLTKPTDFEDLLQIMHAFQGYWFWTDMEPEAFRTPSPKNTGRSS
jgi:CheY-like chemotaxis protein